MTDFTPPKKHLREVLLHLYLSKKSAAQSRRLLVKAYGENVPSVTTCRDWYRRFKIADYCLDDKERSGQPKKFSDDELKALIQKNPCQTLEELASVFNVDRSTVGKRLHNLGMVQKSGNWTCDDAKEGPSNKRAKLKEAISSGQEESP